MSHSLTLKQKAQRATRKKGYLIRLRDDDATLMGLLMAEKVLNLNDRSPAFQIFMKKKYCWRQVCFEDNNPPHELLTALPAGMRTAVRAPWSRAGKVTKHCFVYLLCLGACPPPNAPDSVVAPETEEDLEALNAELFAALQDTYVLEQAPDKELTAKAAADLFAQVYDKTDPSTKEFKCPLPQPPASD